MNCPFCGEQLQRNEDLRVSKTWKGLTVTFNGVKGWKCGHCGEQIYDAGQVSLMEAVIEGTADTNEIPEIVNVEELADYLRVTEQTIYNMLKAGKIPALKVGREWRFRLKDVTGALSVNVDSLARQINPGIAARFSGGAQLSDEDKLKLLYEYKTGQEDSEDDSPPGDRP